MGGSNDKTPQFVDHVNESSDEEIDEDTAFNSDDERKYGSLFPSSKRKRSNNIDDSSDDDSVVNDGDDDGSEDSDDGIASDDEDGDGGQFMLDLLNNLDEKEDDTMRKRQEMKALMAHTSMIPESEHSSTAVKSSSLTLDQLMSGIQDTKGFESVKTVMRDMTSTIYQQDSSSKLSTTKTPVANIISERAERKVNYDDQVEKVSDWTQIVKKNREAETLDFRPKDRVRINKAELVQKFEPTTDFEKEIAAALEEAGAADEKEIMKKEEQEMFGENYDDFDDDLGHHKLSLEEYRKRLGELSKMRALMFYEEQKRHHINKIKSKKYRKIRKKQRLRNKEEEDNEAVENDEELARELEEKSELERMKERMSLKHRNTSKWAKRVLRRGGNIDLETRKALSEQILKGDELKKKMMGQFGDSDDDDQELDLISEARKVLVETEKSEDGKKHAGIFKLDFMKKGIEAQRERAKEEARELLRELEGNENNDELDSDIGSEGEDEIISKKKVSSSADMEQVLGNNKLVASSLTFGNSNSIQVSGDINIETSTFSTKPAPSAHELKTITLATNTDVEIETESNNRLTGKIQSGTSVSIGKASSSNVSEEFNPWLIPDEESHKNDDMNGSSIKKIKNSSRGIVNVADAVNILTNEDKTENNNEINKDGKSNISGKVAKLDIVNMSQDELVRKAFATPSEKDIEAEFEQEKASKK